jgi:hypothetical protein
MTKIWMAIAPALLLAGCATQGVDYPKRPKIKIDAPSRIPIPALPGSGATTTTTQPATGLNAVMGKDRAALVNMFGLPRLDIVEARGRKLQFTGTQCILDTYLYPEGRNDTEIVTHVDARRSDGAEVDKASCIASLQKR